MSMFRNFENLPGLKSAFRRCLSVMNYQGLGTWPFERGLREGYPSLQMHLGVFAACLHVWAPILSLWSVRFENGNGKVMFSGLSGL